MPTDPFRRLAPFLLLGAALAAWRPAHATNSDNWPWISVPPPQAQPARAGLEDHPRIKADGSAWVLWQPSASYRELVEAARRGDGKRVRELIADGIPGNAADELGDTALSEAIARGDHETARVLLDAGADPDQRDGAGLTPLGQAVLVGDLRIARLLLKRGARVDARSANGDTPLLAAVALNRPAFIRLLLDAGADTRPRDREGRSALIMAVVNRRHDAVRDLLAGGADPDWPDGNARMPPLFHAALRRDRESIALLLAAGADPRAMPRGAMALDTWYDVLVGAGADLSAFDPADFGIEPETPPR